MRSPAYKTDAKYGLTSSTFPNSPFKYRLTILPQRDFSYRGKEMNSAEILSRFKNSKRSFACVAFPDPSAPSKTINLPFAMLFDFRRHGFFGTGIAIRSVLPRSAHISLRSNYIPIL